MIRSNGRPTAIERVTGLEQLPGSGRRFINPSTGEILTYRSALDQYHQLVHGTNFREYSKRPGVQPRSRSIPFKGGSYSLRDYKTRSGFMRSLANLAKKHPDATAFLRVHGIPKEGASGSVDAETDKKGVYIQTHGFVLSDLYTMLYKVPWYDWPVYSRQSGQEVGMGDLLISIDSWELVVRDED